MEKSRQYLHEGIERNEGIVKAWNKIMFAEGFFGGVEAEWDNSKKKSRCRMLSGIKWPLVCLIWQY